MDLFDVRKNYKKGHLNPEDLKVDPINQIEQWLDEAATAKCLEHSAIVLSTVSKEGGASSRIVLLKKIDKEGLYFFTNYQSRKGQQIAANNKGALLLFWPELERQINIEGSIEKCSEALSDFYFNSRPLESRISALVSRQSTEIESREVMIKPWQEALKKAKEQEISRPDNWGGYILKPTRIEFWQGGANRFHDRIVFTPHNEGWKKNRLMP